jgi:Flp pilus assembly protein TadD
MPEPSLGLIMIVRDEAHNLGRSLVPVASLFDEVVVVDTGSRDGTPRLCAELGARVFYFPWRDHFAAARNHSIARARADWLFWLDADNAITPEDVAELRRRLPAEGPAILWAQEWVVPRGGRLWQKRSFPRHPEVRFQGRVHEQLVHPPHWPSVPTKVVVRHWGYADPTQVEAKGRYYLQLLDKTLQESPEDFYAHFQAARCCHNLGKLEQALEHLQAVVTSPQARERNPELWAQAHFLLARLLLRLGRGQEARESLDRLLETTPSHGLAHYHRGRLAYREGDWEAAARHLSQALAHGFGMPLVEVDTHKTLFFCNYFLGRALAALGRAPEALAPLARAAELEPDNPAPAVELARLLASLGRTDEARAKLKQILRRRPTDRQAQRLLSRLEEAA